jgi:hypothetical protein
VSLSIIGEPASVRPATASAAVPVCIKLLLRMVVSASIVVHGRTVLLQWIKKMYSTDNCFVAWPGCNAGSHDTADDALLRSD